MGKLIWSIFWALVGIFVIFVSLLIISFTTHLPSWIETIIWPTWFILFALGGTLLLVSKNTIVSSKLKKFLVLTGASAMVTPISVFIDAMVAVLYYNEGGYVFVAVPLCAIAFITGVTGTIVIARKNKPSIPAGTP